MGLRRSWLAAPFLLAAAWAQFRESGEAALAGHLELAVEPRMPARVYLFKDGRPFRLSPVQAMLPLRVDLFYRERLWRNTPNPETLEVTCNDFSHFLLLKGQGRYDLAAGKYRVEAYRGLFYRPAVVEFELKAGETTKISLRLDRWTNEEWLSSDDHIHLVRSREDDAVFLDWLRAEDLSVANFLQLQRQMDAATQYGFGRAAEARLAAGYSIRSGHESRSEFFGHINLLGGREMMRPLSIGTMYANTRLTDDYPALLFVRGKAAGATVGYAHFNGSTPHSALLMDVALGNIQFVEVFQFGVLKKKEWYQLLNAGFRVTGIAGSDFPVPLNRTKEWPRYISLLGPERTLVRGRGFYDEWAAGVRKGEVVVSNGPVIDFVVDRGSKTAHAKARFFRPLESVEIVINGEVAASRAGDGTAQELEVTAKLPEAGAWWAAARAAGRRLEGEPEIQAHTNPVYEGEVRIGNARAELARQWEAEVQWYRQGPLEFSTAARREAFFAAAEKALGVLRQ